MIYAALYYPLKPGYSLGFSFVKNNWNPKIKASQDV